MNISEKLLFFSDEINSHILSGNYPKFIKHIIRFISRKSFLSLADQAVVSAANFITGVIVGRCCTKEGFGLYMLGFSIILFVYDMQISLFATPYMVHSPRLKGKDLAEYTGSVLIHQIFFSVIIVFLLFIGWMALKSGFGPEGLSPVILTLTAVICFIMLREFIRRICFARMFMGTALILDTAAAFFQLGGLLFLMYLGVLSVWVVFLAAGIACFVAGMAWLILGRTIYRFSAKRISSDFFRGWSFGKWVFASGVLWAVSMNIYPWFLVTFHGAASTGVWAACIGVVSVINPVFSGVQNYLGPKIATVFAQNGADALKKFVIRANVIFLAFTLVFCIVLFFAGEKIAVFIYGGGYTGTGAAITVLGVSLLAGTVGFIFSRVLFAMERADIDFAVNFAALFVLLAAGITMVRAWGPFGAALGMACSNIISSGIRCAVAFNLLGKNAKAAE